MSASMLFALAVFAIAYILISTDVIHKTLIALLGAMIFVASGVISQERAFHHVDWNVIFLLLSMMVIVSVLKKTGFSHFLAIKAAKIARGEPRTILRLFILLTAILSAMLGTVTATLLLVPVSILIAIELDISPMPFIISEAMAANIGGCATMVGDATTIMISSAFHLDFVDYMKKVDVILSVILAVFTVIMPLFFRKQLKVTNERKARILEFDENKSIQNIPLLIKSGVVITLVIAGFLTHSITGLEVATIALLGAAVLMVLAGGKEIDHYLAEIEWGTLLFFIGLFILVAGVVEAGVIDFLGRKLIALTGGNLKVTTLMIVWASGVISAIVDNVPYVATMIPLVQSMGTQMGGDPTPLWLSLLLGADLGGNGTLVGATANVVAVGLAAKSGIKVSFMDFTRYGVIITIINLVLVSGFMLLVYLR